MTLHYAKESVSRLKLPLKLANEATLRQGNLLASQQGKAHFRTGYWFYLLFIFGVCVCVCVCVCVLVVALLPLRF